jgi:hypothetical protein
MPQLTAETLLLLGFKDIAVWVRSGDDDGIDYHVDGPNAEAHRSLLNERNSLYAFVQGNQVSYIGKTTQTIRQRLAGYRTPHRQRSTNWRCNGKIREMLASGEVIRILVFTPIPDLRYGEFGINLAAGLEDSLIAAFSPPWNGRERGRAITEDAEREKADEQEAASAPTGATDDLPAADITNGTIPSGVASFRIVLGEAYYELGLINPGVEASAHLGDDGDPIEICFGDGSEPIMSRIDRRANRSGSVRVVGRNQMIKRWFQSHFDKGDTVEARVLDRHRIVLLSKAAKE